MSTQDYIDDLSHRAELEINHDDFNKNSANIISVTESETDETADFEGGSSSRVKSRQVWFKRADAWLSLTSKMFIIAGGIFAVVQFMAAKTNHRVEKTFEYIAAYERGPMLVSRENIRRVLRPYGISFIENPLSYVDFPRLILSIAEGETGTNLEDDLDRVVDFHEGLCLCLKLELCDGEVVKNYFFPKAEKFQSIFMPYIEERRKLKNPNYGVELDWFTSNQGENRSCEKVESSS
ncbi:MAG: hypothetical protein ACJAS9_001713 [Polaribacter sp.]|jgi:hypothetical protein